MRRFALLVVLALAAAGCGGALSSEPEPDSPGGAASGPAPPPAESEASEGSEAEESQEADEDELSVPTHEWETDFSKHSVPLGEFLSGGPGKDGIPAIDVPAFVPVEEAGQWVEPDEPVVEVVVDGVARAYPLQILVWHEIVNDEIAGVPVAVTFCPLCYTVLAFDRRLDGEVLDFGTTGNLRNSDLVMYDRQTESWWQQFSGEAIVGELTGKMLTPVPAALLAFSDFVERHPDGEVLSRETGHSRPYGSNPYVGYDTVDSPPFFPVENLGDDRLQPKARVVLILRGDEAVVVPFTALEQAGRVEVTAGGEALEVVWIPGVRSALDSGAIADGQVVGSAEVRSVETGELVPFDTPFWFAVAAFRPDARIVQ